MGDYPLGAANDPRAPYNEKENPEVEIEVTVVKSGWKVFKIKVSDYDILDEGVDEDGFYYVDRDYSNCDLYSAVCDQCDLNDPSGWEYEIEDIF